VLNLHCMYAGHVSNLGNTPFLFWFLNSSIHLPTFSFFLDFFPYLLYLFSSPLWNSSSWFPIFVISVCTSTCIDSICRRIAQLLLNSVILVRLELFRYSYSFFFLNRRLLFLNAVYCTSLPVWISVYKCFS